MKRMIAGIGETVLDMVLKDGKPLAAVPGGSVFNAMVSLGRTAAVQFPGVEIRMVSRMGRDTVADIISSFMEENHLATDGMSRYDGQSSLTLAVLDAHNNARYEFFRQYNLPEFQVPEGIAFAPDDLVLFGSTFAISGGTAVAARKFVRAARAAGAIVYYDINFRKGIPAAPEAVAENIALSDIVRASSDDIEALYGTSDGEAVYREYIAPLCPNFILTRGAKDAEVFSPGVRAVFPVAPVREVVTTIGAGDNFNAGTLYSLVRDGFKRDQLAALSEEDWRRIIPTAMRFSAEVCGSLFNYVSPEFVRGLQQV